MMQVDINDIESRDTRIPDLPQRARSGGVVVRLENNSSITELESESEIETG